MAMRFTGITSIDVSREPRVDPERAAGAMHAGGVTRGRCVPMKALPTYEIRIAGRVDEATLTSFAGLPVRFRDEVTVIIGQFDQAGLHGMLEMIRSLGLDLLEARPIEVSPPTDDPGATDRGQHGAISADPGRRPR